MNWLMRAAIVVAPMSLVACSAGSEVAPAPRDNSQASSVSTPVPVEEGTCAKEFDVPALLEAMPEEFAGLPHDPTYDSGEPDGWGRFYQRDGLQFMIDASYLDEGETDTCPQDNDQAARDVRSFIVQDYQRQEEENGEEVKPFEELDFSEGGRYFACAKHPEADLRQFFCVTSVGNAEVINFMFRHSQGDAKDVEDMKGASKELAALIDGVA
ncbi:hypothetical protein ACUY2X_11405 [Corynebacterium minutissimum]|uniref:hypothetical protein n=1 Tax=Corynebacterium sp. MSK218 TaxID=3050218 RepID=UPI0025518AFC|nr:hypothetical protein [Corynebacterium sp. MSK218]MDK8762587.1 hypothetical protein [Corynebacterium sp. MSK218]